MHSVKNLRSMFSNFMDGANCGCIAMIRRSILGNLSNYLDVIYKFVDGHVKERNMNIQDVATSFKIADVLTKSHFVL